MPIRTRRVSEPAPQSRELLERLAQEWRTPQEHEPQPVIVVEGGGARPRHLFVIWDRWGDLNQQDRSEIIMDAYAQTLSEDDVLQVTVAMGLTVKEAERMGIHYQ